MTISAESVRFGEYQMWVDLSDGRTLGVPLAWFPKLLAASVEDLNAVEISATGLHWDALEEDVSIAGLLAGRAARTRGVAEAA